MGLPSVAQWEDFESADNETLLQVEKAKADYSAKRLQYPSLFLVEFFSPILDILDPNLVNMTML